MTTFIWPGNVEFLCVDKESGKRILHTANWCTRIFIQSEASPTLNFSKVSCTPSPGFRADQPLQGEQRVEMHSSISPVTEFQILTVIWELQLEILNYWRHLLGVRQKLSREISSTNLPLRVRHQTTRVLWMVGLTLLQRGNKRSD